MTIKTGDTVKLIAPFGLNAQGEAEYPDVYDIGKYGSVTHKDGEYFNVKLFSSGAEYAALENELQKITFYIVDHKGVKVADVTSYEEANKKLEELMEGDGYWYIYGSDDNDEAWTSGGLSEYEAYNQAA
jgi:hypothetical protein